MSQGKLVVPSRRGKMEYPINESSILLVIAGIATAGLVGMLAHFSVMSFFSKRSNSMDDAHYTRD